MPDRRHVLRVATTLLGSSALRTRAQPQPERRLRLLCASPPGGLPDLLARRVARELEARRGGPVIVENRPGAGGLVVVNALRQAPGDPQGWLLAHGGLLTLPSPAQAGGDFEPNHALQPACTMAEAAFVLAAGGPGAEQSSTLQGWLAWARATKRPLTLGSPGNGTAPHLLGLMLAAAAGFAVQHVPYGGGPPAMADLLGGRLDALILPLGVLRPALQQPGILPLALTAARRSPALPQVPTFKEAGFASLVAQEWFGFFLHRDVAPARVEAVGRELLALLGDLAEWIRAQDLEPLLLDRAALGPRIAAERRRWQQVLESLPNR